MKLTVDVNYFLHRPSGKFGRHKPPSDSVVSDDATKDEFNEQQHPRGQPENKGEFVKGAGSKGAAPAATKPAAPARGARAGGAGAGRAGAAGAAAALKPAAIQGGKWGAADGSPLPPHIAKLRIPPAWTNVKFDPNPKAACLVTGQDAKGRRTAMYAESFRNSMAASKWSRIGELSQKITGILQQVSKDRQATDPVKRGLADCLYVIIHTGIRPGSEKDTGAEKQAYGATTLQGQHIVNDGKQVFLRFTGKKGVSLNLPVINPEVASLLQQRAKQAGPDGKVFGDIDERKLLDYTHSQNGGKFKTKDFRTHLGTQVAMAAVKSMPVPANKTQYKQAVKEVATKVSQRLGNTPAIALSSYIVPSVFSDWSSNAG